MDVIVATPDGVTNVISMDDAKGDNAVMRLRRPGRTFVFDDQATNQLCSDSSITRKSRRPVVAAPAQASLPRTDSDTGAAAA